MKKTLIAMAAVAVAGVASAQVSITGAIGFGVSDSSTTANSMDWTDGKITFAASEDLGGGLSLSASKTIAFNGDNTNAVSDGDSLSVAGGFGTVAFSTVSADADSLGVASLPTDSGATIAASVTDYTMLNYTLPSLVDGLGITVRWTNSATAVTTATVDEQIRLTYKMGAANLGYNSKKGAADFSAGYDFGVAKINYFTQTKVAAGSDKRTEMSVSAPIGNGFSVAASKMSYSGANTTKGKEFDVQYSLSKRTTVRAGYGTFTNSSNVDSSAKRIKLVHTF